MYRIGLTFESCCWMLIVFLVKSAGTGKIYYFLLAALLLLLSIVLTRISLCKAKKLNKDSRQGACAECTLADSNFLPIYLGYFFVSLSVPNWITMCIVFVIVFLFSFLSGSQLFNPLFLLFGYHYYFIKTTTGTSLFLIKKGPVIRNVAELDLDNLYRINNSSFFQLERRN